MKKLFLIFIIFISCRQDRLVNLTDEVDPDIVIVNIEEGDRAFIGRLLLTIDSCKPKLIGIDAWFKSERDPFQDSVLLSSLKLIDNDILSYNLDSLGRVVQSHDKFRKYASEEGLAVLENIDGLSSHIKPISVIDNEDHELFPLKIVKKWKPDLVSPFYRGELIPIRFTRTLDQFLHFNGSSLSAKNNFKDLNDKIVLLGYLGPLDEDKHFTPIRQVINYNKGEPDTYGVVIVANEIRTILEYED